MSCGLDLQEQQMQELQEKVDGMRTVTAQCQALADALVEAGPKPQPVTS